MELLLLRHGLAEERDWDDAGRALTAEGRRKSELAGRGLAQLDVVPTEVWTSPWRRAVETAAAACPDSPATIVEALANHPVKEVLAVLRLLPPPAVPLLIGHEPQLSSLAETLVGARPGALRLRKCGFIWVSVNLATWPLTPGQVQCLLTPAQLRGLGARA